MPYTAFLFFARHGLGEAPASPGAAAVKTQERRTFMQHGSRICLLWEEARELAGLYGRWFWGHYRRELRRYPFWLMMSLAGSTLTEILSFAGPNLISPRLDHSAAYQSLCNLPSLMLLLVARLGEAVFPTSPYDAKVFTIFAGFPAHALFLAFVYVTVILALRDASA